MEYKVIVSEEAEADLDRYIRYLFAVKRNEQAAREATVKALKNVAGSLKLCDNEQLRKQGYRRINFLSHRYFLIYRIVDDTVFVDNIFHEMQDYENKMM